MLEVFGVWKLNKTDRSLKTLNACLLFSPNEKRGIDLAM